MSNNFKNECMSTMRNRVQLIGRIGQTPEIKMFNERKRAVFSLAVNETYYNKSGEKVENTYWHTITVWEAQANFVEKFVEKGKMIGLEGKLITRNFEDKEGVKRFVTEIVVSEFLLF